MSRVELLTAEPIGAGSRFGIEMTMMRRVFDMTVEFTDFQRPRLRGSTSRSLPRRSKGRPLLTATTPHLRGRPGRNADALVLARRGAARRTRHDRRRLLARAVAFYARLGISVERLLTDNGSAYRAIVHAVACRKPGIRHLRSGPTRPQTNGKAERHPHPPERLGLRRHLPLEPRTQPRP
jgi:hypothetical protein